jgi:hypothetical protein
MSECDSEDEEGRNVLSRWMKIKYPSNYDLYDVIKIIFNQLTELCAHLMTEPTNIVDKIAGDVKHLGIPLSEHICPTGYKTIELSRENTKYITYINREDIELSGEILEDGTFIHDYVPPRSRAQRHLRQTLKYNALRTHINPTTNDVDIYAYREFYSSHIRYLELYRMSGNYLFLNIVVLKENPPKTNNLYEFEKYFKYENYIFHCMKIAHHNKDFYHLIHIVFDNITKLFKPTLHHPFTTRNCIAGELKHIPDIIRYGRLPNGHETTKLTRKNAAHIGCIFNTIEPYISYSGEILANGKFIHNYPPPPRAATADT